MKLRRTSNTSFHIRVLVVEIQLEQNLFQIIAI